jgi:hypothetical protein
MPTTNPRVNVTLSPSLDALVARMARLQEVSKSQVLRELLEAAEPALQRAATFIEAASRARAEVLGGIGQSLEQAQDSLERNMHRELSKLDAMTADLVDQAEAVKGRRRRRAASPAVAPPQLRPEPQNPPASNRGVKSARQAVAGSRKGGSGGTRKGGAQ